MADEIHMKWNDFEENIREAFKVNWNIVLLEIDTWPLYEQSFTFTNFWEI